MTMTDSEIEHVRRVGRDEVNRRTTIGLTEFDELCDAALARNAERRDDELVAATIAIAQLAAAIAAGIVQRSCKDGSPLWSVTEEQRQIAEAAVGIAAEIVDVIGSGRPR